MRFPTSFTKMSGTGNDFILIDHREPVLARAEMPAFARALCRRGVSVGADGLIFIEKSATADFCWQFLNADGSWAEMCGNGARCAARFAREKGIAPARMRFETVAGLIEAEVKGSSVKLKMTAPGSLRLGEKIMVAGQEQELHSLNTGVPHAVLFVTEISEAPVAEMGRIIRYHEHFQPAGTNVNFVTCTGPDSLAVRTYERGVEGETLACGTGAVAAAIIAGLLGRVAAPVTVTTSGGEELIIHYQLCGQEINGVYLEGPARFVYEGRLHEEALPTKF